MNNDMAEDNMYRGERLSFFKMFSQKKYKLVVPIIQRDFAQGRKSEDTNELRMDFLDALYGYLDDNIPNRDLDFVYGTLQTDDNGADTHFIPLDGQQRLTTLFLLHWFLYQISSNQTARDLFISNLMRDEKSLFTYETRQSSTDFCDCLMRSSIDMESLYEVKVKIDNKETSVPSLSETLKNQPWFFRFWKKDPTVTSMLVMLDAIYDRFKGHPEFFERLLDEENPIITFIFMDLKEYKLTDDLYIKMNSRGKPLSKFENFKAKFEQYLKEVENSEKLNGRKFYLTFGNQQKEVSLHRYFSFNIDTKWTTLLWQYSRNLLDTEKTDNQNKLDTYMENFIRIVITNQYALDVNLPGKVNSDETLDVLTGPIKSLSYNKYASTDALSVRAILSIIDSFDILYNGSNKIKHYISDEYKFYFNEDAVFQKIIENKTSLSDRMQFFAYILYLVNYKDNLEGINEWMRVIHNLTHLDNTITDSNSDFSRGLKSILTLSEHATDIIGYLKTVSSISGIFKRQSVEECMKARLITMDGWKDIIENTEKHPYFNGQIGFMLEFSDINPLKEGELYHWSDAQNLDYLAKFKRNSTIGTEIFALNDRGRRKNDIDYKFERAVLSHGDYLLEGSYNHWNLLSTETVAKNVKRDLSWKRLLRINETDENWTSRRNFVRATFDDIEDINNVNESFRKLCVPKTNNTWRNILISSSKMFDVCEKGFVCFYDKYVLLLGKWFLNHYHAELFTYHLWCKKFGCCEEPENQFKGFYTQYAWQKCSDVIPFIYLSDFLYHRNRYEIKIEACCDGDCEFQKFIIKFGFKNTKKFDYPEEISSLVKNQGFKNLDSFSNLFTFSTSSENNAYKKVCQLVDELNDLKK